MSADRSDALSPEERRLLDELRAARSLANLVRITEADTEDDAYFRAKSDWYSLREKELPPPKTDGFPGDAVTVEDVEYVVHGVTHADTDEERSFLRGHVSRLLDDGAAVYCEQGIRSMYFDDLDDVREVDDYQWSTERCRALGVASCVEDADTEGVSDGVAELRSRFRSAVFSLIDSGRNVYGERFADAVGDVASDFLTSRGELGKGDDFEGFRLSRQAALEPTMLGELQRYYKKKLLPQPVEREWLRRHDPEIEAFTHARNERIADYAVYDSDADDVHIVAGAAHQPGVIYYLRRHRDGESSVDGFEYHG